MPDLVLKKTSAIEKLIAFIWEEKIVLDRVYIKKNDEIEKNILKSLRLFLS